MTVRPATSVVSYESALPPFAKTAPPTTASRAPATTNRETAPRIAEIPMIRVASPFCGFRLSARLQDGYRATRLIARGILLFH